MVFDERTRQATLAIMQKLYAHEFEVAGDFDPFAQDDIERATNFGGLHTSNIDVSSVPEYLSYATNIVASSMIIYHELSKNRKRGELITEVIQIIKSKDSLNLIEEKEEIADEIVEK